MILELSRRQMLKTAFGGLVLAASPAQARGFPSRIACLDYGAASTLLSLGVVPEAVASLADWDVWVIEPEMPSSVMDLGNSWEVNLELLTALKPDLILTSPYLEAQRPRLELIGPVLRLDVYTPEGGDILPRAIAATMQIGETIGRQQAAKEFLARAEDLFNQCRERIARLQPPPVALVSFMDARHVRIYGSPGLYHSVLTRIGLENGWAGQANYWGFETIGVEQLSRISNPETRLIAIEPVPADVLPKLARSPLWSNLPFSQPSQFSVIPGVLIFGMVSDAVRMARILTDHLEQLA